MDDYESFKKAVYSLTKIDLSSYKEKQMRRRIDAIATKNGCSNYEDYVKVLRSDKEKFEQFVNFLTINVSEFYRNPDQWKLMDQKVIPKLIKEQGRRLKIWSAACSTGDEPYTIAMILQKYLPKMQYEIIATDIDDQVLDKAANGLYHAKSISGVPDEYMQFFEKISNDIYQISDKIINMVKFKQHNLLKDPYITGCDLIVCRNVLIYFTDEAKDDIFMKFNNALNKNGILFIGNTEQILTPKAFGFTTIKSFFYTKE